MNVTLVIFIVLFILKILDIKDIPWWVIAIAFFGAVLVSVASTLLDTRVK